MKPLKCPFVDKCLNCTDLDKQANAYTCKIWTQWFKAQANDSLRSHGRALAANPF